MQKKLAAFLTSVLIFTYENVYAITPSANQLPSETIILKSPNASYTSWKEIARHITHDMKVVEYIPSNYQIANWSDLICIQYFNKDYLAKGASESIENVIELLQIAKLSPNVIEKNKSDAIYEIIYEKAPLEHVVSRIFLTDTGLHRIGFTKKQKKMNSKERELCINSLRDSVSIVSIKEAKNTPQGLSLLDRIQDSLNLGKTFENWEKIDTTTIQNGYTVITWIPPIVNVYVDESLEVKTMPNIYEMTLDQFFEFEKQLVQSETHKPVNFVILKKSPKEIIYTSTHRKDLLEVTGIVRAFLSNQGFYSIGYKHCGLPNQLKPEKIQFWKEKLEEIKIEKKDDLPPIIKDGKNGEHGRNGQDGENGGNGTHGGNSDWGRGGNGGDGGNSYHLTPSMGTKEEAMQFLRELANKIEAN